MSAAFFEHPGKRMLTTAKRRTIYMYGLYESKTIPAGYDEKYLLMSIYGIIPPSVWQAN
jgi:hypothetical protein